MRFEWNEDKARANIAKHGISFETASRVFSDMNRVEFFDKKHSKYERRYIAIGMVDEVVYLINVVFTERDESIRIISARKATSEERRLYYDRT